MIVMLPEEVARVVATEAAKRGLTPAVLFGRAVGEFLENHPVDELPDEEE